MTRELFKTKKEIAFWLDSARIKEYTINDDLTVDTHGNVYLQKHEDLIKRGYLPFNFGVAHKSFQIVLSGLTTLEGSPEKVYDDFRVHRNNLTSLMGAPKYVQGEFACDYNELTDLVGAPDYVGKGFSCTYNKISSLQGAPKELGKNITISNNPIKSLEGFNSVLTPGFYVYFDNVDAVDLLPYKNNQQMKGSLPFSALRTDLFIDLLLQKKIEKEKSLISSVLIHNLELGQDKDKSKIEQRLNKI